MDCHEPEKTVLTMTVRLEEPVVKKQFFVTVMLLMGGLVGGLHSRKANRTGWQPAARPGSRDLPGRYRSECGRGAPEG